MFLFLYQSTQNFCKQNNTTQLTELREKIINCNPNSNICSTELIPVFLQNIVLLLKKAMIMIHLGKCTTLVKMESVPPINLRKYVLGKSSTPLKKW